MNSTASPLVQARNLVMSFDLAGSGRPGHARAVDDVSFEIYPGESLGLVGESGSGKSTIGRLLVGLLQPTAGQVLFDGRDLASLRPAELRRLRQQMQIVFQDPYSTLNPRHNVRTILSRPLHIHGLASGRAMEVQTRRLLSLVGLSDHYLTRMPNALSGGERQRIAIARALALEPRFIVLDEPTSALDVSVQAQIINLLMDLKSRLQLTYLFISHNLSLVEHVCDRTMVMYAGKLVEAGPTTDLHNAPFHPYTRALLGSTLTPSAARSAIQPLAGDVPSAWNPPPGCRFHPRCPIGDDGCRAAAPQWLEVRPKHFVACFKA